MEFLILKKYLCNDETKIKIHKNIFDNEKNDQGFGASSKGNEFNNYQ